MLYKVQLHEDGWHDCVRVDIDRHDLPAAFETKEEAAQYIQNLLEMLHMDRGASRFRIVPV